MIPEKPLVVKDKEGNEYVKVTEHYRIVKKVEEEVKPEPEYSYNHSSPGIMLPKFDYKAVIAIVFLGFCSAVMIFGILKITGVLR